MKLFLCSVMIAVSFCLYAQEKESSEIHKTRSSATIGGVKYYLHTVEKGQTLFAIAKFYGKDVNDIVIDNPEAIDGIKPGQVLKIAMEKKNPTAITQNDTASVIYHKVEKGQTLYSITKQYGISEEKLRAINPELKDGLKLGQTIKIPSVKHDLVKPLVKDQVETVKTNNLNPTHTNQETGVTTNSNSSTSKPANGNEAADHITTGTTTYSGEKKSCYEIAYFLPFHAEEVNAMDLDKLLKGDLEIPNRTGIALSFYEGAKLALDSLKKIGLNANIHVYDIDDKDSATIFNLLKKPEMAKMDLFFGPLYGSGFMPVAKFAKEHQIAIVSPFTQINKILFNNPYVCKLSASTTLQVERMADFVVDSMSDRNIILVNNLNVKELPFFTAFKTKANADLLAKGKSAADSVKIAVGLSGVQSLLNSSKENVVILPTNNQSYVTDFISKLNIMSDKHKITLFGLQSWTGFDNLDFEYLNNLKVHFPANTFNDYELPSTIEFVKEFRIQFNTEPDTYAFQGFDATYYFLHALKNNGTGFLQELTKTPFSGLQSQFQFAQFPAESGFENRSVFILKYQDYKLVKAN